MVKGGQSNEVAAIIEIVAAAVALGREIIECYFLLKSEFGRKPTSEEVLRRLIGKREHHPKVSAKRKQLATAVINRLDP